MTWERTARLTGALVGALVLLTLGAAPALAAPRWLAPVPVSSEGVDAGSSSLAVGRAGHAVLAWTEGGGPARTLRARLRAAGAPDWGPALDLSSPGAVVLGEVVVDAVGNAVILFSEFSGMAGTLRVARIAPGAGTADVQDVSDGAAFVFSPSLAVDGRGGLVVAWRQNDGPSGSRALIRARTPEGVWSPIAAASDPAQAPSEVDVAADADGDAVVIFTNGPQRALTLLAVRRSADGTLSASRELSAAGDVGSASVAVDPAGNAVAAWVSMEGSTPRVRAATQAVGADWTPPEALGPAVPAPFDQVTATALVEPDGTASVVWYAGPTAGVLARARPLGGAWGPETRLSPTDVEVSGPQAPRVPLAASGPGGGVIATWTRAAGAAPGIVQAALRPAGAAAFEPALDISRPGLAAVAPVAAVAPAGEAVAAWTSAAQGLGSTRTVLAADYTGRPGEVLPVTAPTIDRLEGPRRATAGTIVRLRVRFGAFADRALVQVQRRRGAGFEDVGGPVRVSGTSVEVRSRLVAPGSAVVRVVVPGSHPAIVSPTLAIAVTRPTRPIAQVDGRPEAVRTGEGGVWVLSRADDGAASVVRVDPRTGRPGPPIPVGRARAIAVGAGAVWVARGPAQPDGLARIDPRTGAVTEIPLVTSGEVAVGGAGVFTVECQPVADPFRIPFCGEQRLARIDPATNAVTRRAVVVGANEEGDPAVVALAVGRRRLWLTVATSDETGILEYDPATDAARGLAVSGLSFRTAARGDLLWGVSPGICALVRATPGSALVRRGSVAGRPRLSCGRLLIEGSSVWVAQNAVSTGPAPTTAPSRIVRLSAATSRPVGIPIGVGVGPFDHDVGFGRVWVAYPEAGVVTAIDPRPAARATPRTPARPARVRLAATWGRASTVSRPAGGTATAVDLAVAPGGRSVVVLRQERGRVSQTILAARRPSGHGAWSAPQVLGRSRGSYGDRPRVVANDAGAALAIWSARDPGSDFRVRASLLGPRARSWGPATPLSAADTRAIEPRPALARDGSALASWGCLCNPGGVGPLTTSASARPPGGPWGMPRTLQAPGELALDAQLAASRSGAAVALWSDRNGQIRASSRPARAAFGPSVDISPGTPGGSPAVATNDRGQALAVWVGGGAAFRSAYGRWSAPVEILPPGRFALEEPEVGLDDAGNAIVAMRAFDDATFAFRVVVVTRRGRDGVWSGPVALSPRGPTSGRPAPGAARPSLAVSPRGEAIIAWAQTVNGSSRAVARRRAPGAAAWGRLEDVSGPQRGVSGLRVALARDGSAGAAWTAILPGARPRPTVARVAMRLGRPR